VNHKVPAQPTGVRSFRTKLTVAMMLVVSAITGLSLYLAERHQTAAEEENLRREFQGELTALHNVQEVRLAALLERSRALVRRSRIHAALEDNAPDLLYPSAKDELRDVMEAEDMPPEQTGGALHAQFYRFLDAKGAVISPENAKDVGELSAAEEVQLALKTLPDKQQIGYLVGNAPDRGHVAEIIAMPIVSTETGEVIAAIVLGFKPFGMDSRNMGLETKRGIWTQGELFLPALAQSTRTELGNELKHSIGTSGLVENSFMVRMEGEPRLLFYKLLNADSLFPPAYEVCVYPLAPLVARQAELRWQILGAGALLLLAALGVSYYLSGRLSRPVEKLAVDSEVNRTQRAQAEAALELSHEELQRVARFSADASHQLKTPVTVLRAGLEELMARNHLPANERDEISALIHQTYRLAGIIEDLLLLSRMDSGHLELKLAPLNLSQIIEGWMDDISALPDDLQLQVDTDFAPDVLIAGEKRYTTLILENLLENARKYNRKEGRIEIKATEVDGMVHLRIGNTGPPIPSAAQEHIFERFHRGAAGGNVPGHGLGLNLARELVRLHGGELKLVRSENDWTEFEVQFCVAKPAPLPSLQTA